MPTPRSTPSPLPGLPDAIGPTGSAGGEDGPPPPALLAEIAGRLRRVCIDMDAGTFDALVLDVARFTIRWGREGGPQ